MATLEKYFDKLQVVEKPNGLKEVKATPTFKPERETSNLPKFTPHIACLWLLHEPAPRVGCPMEKDGFCTHLKYCNQKGDGFR